MEVLQDTYKNTKIGRVPKDWEVVKITDVIDLIHGHQFRDYDFVEKGIPIVKIGSLIDGKGIRFDNATFVDSYKLNEFKSYLLKEGDILMALTGATLGKVSKVNTNKIILQNYRVGKFVPKSDSINNIFLYDILQSYLVQNKMWALINQGAQPNIGKADFRLIYIPLPPLPEQQKIAAILSTVDEQISTTDKIIEKSKELKKGLMQKLFSEGIGHTEFKDTKIGRIPKDWNFDKLSNLINLKHGYQFRTDDFTEVGIPIIKINNITGGELDTQNLSFIDSNRLNQFKGFKLFQGDILMSLTGNVGKVIEIKNLNGIYLQNYRVGKFTPANESVLHKSLLKYILSSKLVMNQLSRFSNQSAQANFGKQDLDKIWFGISNNLDEQQKIATILSEADAKIEKEQTQKAQLEALKKGLMQQLLTGKKRVKV